MILWLNLEANLSFIPLEFSFAFFIGFIFSLCRRLSSYGCEGVPAYIVLTASNSKGRVHLSHLLQRKRERKKKRLIEASDWIPCLFME